MNEQADNPHPPSPAVLLRYKQSQPFLEVMSRYSFKSIIDFGCMYGLHVEHFWKTGRRAVGIDICIPPGAIEYADDRYDLWEGDWNHLTGGFDAGFSYHVLEHARDPVAYLHAWGRAIKPGGKLFLVVPAYCGKCAIGHISNGWNIGQVFYNLAVAGFDCVQGRFIHTVPTGIWAIVDRPEKFEIIDHLADSWEEVKARMPALQSDTPRHFQGNMKKVNW